tara:strand:+ start:2001 stop:2870 length:870 start_codon:yes stop_codon:yes gene_type:complete
MKILVLGSSGQLGRCLQDQLKNPESEIIFSSRTLIDIRDFHETKKTISEIQPNIIINAAAYTAVDEAEKNFQEADVINHLAVMNIATICKNLNIFLIHISTDYVFNGYSQTPYTESSLTDPKTIYGKTKLDGENAILKSNCNYAIIRTSWVFSEYGDNFLKTMMKLSAKKNKILVVDDQVGCPTYAQDLAKAISLLLPLIKKKVKINTIYNFCGDKEISWYKFAVFIFSTMKQLGHKVPKHVIKAKSIHMNFVADRPYFSVLNSSKFCNQFKTKPSNWEIAVNKIISNL